MTQGKIEVWNAAAVEYLRDNPTLEFEYNGKTVCIEKEGCRYVAWIKGEDATQAVASTPHKAFSDVI